MKLSDVDAMQMGDTEERGVQRSGVGAEGEVAPLGGASASCAWL